MEYIGGCGGANLGCSGTSRSFGGLDSLGPERLTPGELEGALGAGIDGGLREARSSSFIVIWTGGFGGGMGGGCREASWGDLEWGVGPRENSGGAGMDCVGGGGGATDGGGGMKISPSTGSGTARENLLPNFCLFTGKNKQVQTNIRGATGRNWKFS